MIENLPLVSIIIPSRNEEKFIGKCLNSLIHQDYPKEKMELLVVDGMSEDKTREIILNLKSKITKPEIKLLDNPKKFTNFAFNLGIKEAKGEIIMLAGAHATYEKDYVSKCVQYLREQNADCVGGIMVTLPRENSLISKAIAKALSHWFGVGGSIFRKGVKKVKEVDTVFSGCYKKEVFEKLGGFNENLLKGQDFEFNKRLKKSGGKILLIPETKSYYFARSKLNWQFIKYYFWEGFWAIYPIKFAGKSFFSFWRFIPFFFVFSLFFCGIFSFFSQFFKFLFFGIVFLYLLFDFLASLEISLKEKDFRYCFILPIIFPAIHIPYGIGSGWGVLSLIK